MKRCRLCNLSQEDNIQYGEILTKGEITAHTFCLYLSSNLEQRGADNEGLLGFLPRDINNERRRVSRLKCCYCGNIYANIGCCEKSCRSQFHLVCGVLHNTQSEFVNTYRSFCHKHVRKVRRHPKSDEKCCICYEQLVAPGATFNCVKMLRAPCCQNGWFHKLCLQKFANAAGYFFKCPLCNDNDIFRDKLRKSGVFIPDRDAAWELEPNAYSELLERPNCCCAERCRNKLGKSAESTQDPLIICVTCGSVAMHLLCRKDGNTSDFHCDGCKGFVERDNVSRYESLREQKSEDREEEVEVDICSIGSDDDSIKLSELTMRNSREILNDDVKKRDGKEAVTDSHITVKRSKRPFVIFDDEEQTEKELSATERDSPITVRKSKRPLVIFDDDEEQTEKELSATERDSPITVRRSKRPLVIVDDDSPDSYQKKAIDTGCDSSKPKNSKSESDDSSDDDPLIHFEGYVNRSQATCTNDTAYVSGSSSEISSKSSSTEESSYLEEPKSKSIDKIVGTMRKYKRKEKGISQVNASCVANRTRRRTSLFSTIERLASTTEEELSEMDSCSHSTSSARSESISSSSDCNSFYSSKPRIYEKRLRNLGSCLEPRGKFFTSRWSQAGRKFEFDNKSLAASSTNFMRNYDMLMNRAARNHNHSRHKHP